MSKTPNEAFIIGMCNTLFRLLENSFFHQAISLLSKLGSFPLVVGQRCKLLLHLFFPCSKDMSLKSLHPDVLNGVVIANKSPSN